MKAWVVTLGVAVGTLMGGCRSDRNSATLPTSTVEPASSADPRPNVWIAQQPGLELRALRGPELDALAARIDPRHLRLVSMTAEQLGPTRRLSLEAMESRVQALVGVNGGFFDERERAEGLRVSDGHVLSDPVDRDWGIFIITDGRPRLVHTHEARRIDWQRESFAIQCGPRIIVEGEPLRLKPGQHRRTVIGIDRGRRVVLLATRRPVDLNVLARVLSRSERGGGIALEEALALDGGPSTGFVARKGQPWQIPVRAPVADGVFVVERDATLPYGNPPAWALPSAQRGFL